MKREPIRPAILDDEEFTSWLQSLAPEWNPNEELDQETVEILLDRINEAFLSEQGPIPIARDERESAETVHESFWQAVKGNELPPLPEASTSPTNLTPPQSRNR